VRFAAWYLVLIATHTRGFNTDAPLIAVSWADAGSGMFAFVFAAAVLTLTSRNEPARRVVGGGSSGGLLALIVDIFCAVTGSSRQNAYASGPRQVAARLGAQGLALATSHRMGYSPRFRFSVSDCSEGTARSHC